MKNTFGGEGGPAKPTFDIGISKMTECHFHYTGDLWGSNMTYTTWGNGGCHSGGGKCYSYFATGGSCKI